MRSRAEKIEIKLRTFYIETSVKIFEWNLEVAYKY